MTFVHEDYRQTNAHKYTSNDTLARVLLDFPKNLKKQRLTHLVLASNQDPDAIQELLVYLDSFESYIPCRNVTGGDHAKYFPGHGITLVILLSGYPDRIIEPFIYRRVHRLNANVKDCFSEVIIRYAGVHPAHRRNTPMCRRLMFDQMIRGKVGLSIPEYVLYLEVPRCNPAGEYWLERVDRATRLPNQPFWVKGSLYLGERNLTAGNPILSTHINLCAIYGLEDGDFKKFYAHVIHDSPASVPPDLGIFQQLWSNPIRTLQVIHKFHYSPLFNNSWGNNLDDMKSKSEAAIIIT